MENIIVREFRQDDTAKTAQIFFDAVRTGAANHYNQSQREAWAPQVPEQVPWRGRMLSQAAFVAEYQGRLIGFMTLTSEGSIDLAFVAPDFMGRGVAQKLYEKILMAARKSGFKKLHTEASYLARSFFEREGWAIVREQSKSINNVELENFLMEKDL